MNNDRPLSNRPPSNRSVSDCLVSNRLILVTGAARSGKSEWAEYLAQSSKHSVIYVATAQSDPTDAEWQARIEQHRSRRPVEWQTLHVPIALDATLLSSSPTSCLLVDSLGTWLANHLEEEEATWQVTSTALLHSLQHSSSQVILVGEEAGWGVVPAYELGRRFRDRLGALTRQIGTIADTVYLVTGGYALNVSQLGTRLPPNDFDK
jgi:adenosylcobinamide kinase/adenosylcobinamide-phosphate guanylyltransferase